MYRQFNFQQFFVLLTLCIYVFCVDLRRNRYYFPIRTYSMVQSPFWAANWFATSQEIPRISRNPKVHYRTHKPPQPVSIQGQANPVHIPTSHLLEIHPNIIHPSTPRSPQWSISLRFPHQDPIHPLSSPIRAICPAHLTLLDFITRTIFGIISLYSINWLVFRLFCKIAEGDYYFRHVCQSVCPHGATRLPLDEFLWNFICEHFQNPLRKSKFHWNLTKLTATFHKDPSTFLIISRLFIPRMWNVSDEICRGKQNTNFVFDNVFGESFHLWDNMDKYCTGHRWQYGNIVWCGVWWMWAVLAAVFFRSTDLLVIKVCSLLCKLAVLKFRVGRGGGAPMLECVALTQLAMFSADTLTAPAGAQKQTALYFPSVKLPGPKFKLINMSNL